MTMETIMEHNRSIYLATSLLEQRIKNSMINPICKYFFVDFSQLILVTNTVDLVIQLNHSLCPPSEKYLAKEEIVFKSMMLLMDQDPNTNSSAQIDCYSNLKNINYVLTDDQQINKGIISISCMQTNCIVNIRCEYLVPTNNVQGKILQEPIECMRFFAIEKIVRNKNNRNLIHIFNKLMFLFDNNFDQSYNSIFHSYSIFMILYNKIESNQKLKQENEKEALMHILYHFSTIHNDTQLVLKEHESIPTVEQNIQFKFSLQDKKSLRNNLFLPAFGFIMYNLISDGLNLDTFSLGQTLSSDFMKKIVSKGESLYRFILKNNNIYNRF